MNWNVGYSVIYGLLGGLFEFLPVSPDAHQALLLRLAGLGQPGYGMSLAVHIGALAAVIFSCFGKINKLALERRIAALPPRKRKRQPETVSLSELRLLKTAAIPVVLSCLLAAFFHSYLNRFWLMVIFVVLNGVFIALPHYLTRANKDARSISPLDALLIGLCSILGILPGLSRMGILISAGSIRGMDRNFCLDFTYLLAIPWLIALCVIDIAMLILQGPAGAAFVHTLFALLASFGAGVAGIRMMRFLVVKNDSEGFAYYNWGLAMLAFVIYLIG